MIVRDDLGFCSIHEKDEDGRPDDLVASVWRDDLENLILTAPDALQMLHELHEAMASALALRRMATQPWERGKAMVAIAVWQKVRVFLDSNPMPSKLEITS